VGFDLPAKGNKKSPPHQYLMVVVLMGTLPKSARIYKTGGVGGNRYHFWKKKMEKWKKKNTINEIISLSKIAKDPSQWV